MSVTATVRDTWPSARVIWMCAGEYTAPSSLSSALGDAAPVCAHAPRR